MKRLKLTILIILILHVVTYIGNACSTFCIENKTDLVFGRSFDFSIGFGQVVINKRNIKKKAFIQPPEKPIEWVSKYGSITFNQVGREFPYGGMNETGLVIECMWLAETKYPEMDERHGLEEAQWIQYQLDNAKSVSDVIESDSSIRISCLSPAPIHFLICDKEGNKAAIEYLNGKMVVNTGSDLKVSVLTNYTYEKSLKTLEPQIELASNDTTAHKKKKDRRFAKAATMVQQYNNENIIDYSFKVLDSVKQRNTRWNIVYDIKNMVIYYRTVLNPNRKIIKFAEFDFSCDSPSLFADIDKDMTDQKVVFNEYSYQANRAFIDSAFNNNKFFEKYGELKDAIAKYPETTTCDK